jgi:hypothetical protein
MLYDVTTLTVQPATMPKALPGLQQALSKYSGKLIACWTSEIGALNKIMIIRHFESERHALEHHETVARSDDPHGIAEFTVASTHDVFALLSFLKPIETGTFGPYFEVRDYLLKPGKLAGTIERWEKAIPTRTQRSPLLGCMYSITGLSPRWMHIWPYKTLDERNSVRAGAVKDGIWPPPGGGGTLMVQQTEIFTPTGFSPVK